MTTETIATFTDAAGLIEARLITDNKTAAGATIYQIDFFNKQSGACVTDDFDHYIGELTRDAAIAELHSYLASINAL